MLAHALSFNTSPLLSPITLTVTRSDARSIAQAPNLNDILS